MQKDMIVQLPSGGRMPALGFGTWHATEKELETALDVALEAGYRHIDTAPVYFNEQIIGKVLKKWFDSGKIKRSDIFITTKLPPMGNRPDGVEKWLKKSLADLQLDYVDLYLIHTPFSFVDIGMDLSPSLEGQEIQLDNSTDHSKVWAEMEKQVQCGRAKAIGLSNFTVNQISRILKTAKVPVSNVQVELHLNFQQKELVDFCRSKGITLTAYSPLANRPFVQNLGRSETHPDIMKNPVVLEIAKKHGKSAAQIALRHIVQKGISAIPKSTNAGRIKENIQIFDFSLDANDVQRLNSLDKGPAARICDFKFFKGVDKHPEFPF